MVYITEISKAEVINGLSI